MPPLPDLSPPALPRTDYVLCKIVRRAREQEPNAVSWNTGMLFGAGVTQITQPDRLAEELQPALNDIQGPDIMQAWKICSMAVLGGFFCTVDREKKVSAPLGIIGKKRRGMAFGTIDCAQAPNGLIYQLGLISEKNERCSIAYFDPQQDIKYSRFNPESIITFTAPASLTELLTLHAEAETRPEGWWPRRGPVMRANRPLGSLPCFTGRDMYFSNGVHM